MRLAIYTATFPFGPQEAYLKDELSELYKHFGNIVVLPFKKEDKQFYSLNENIEVISKKNENFKWTFDREIDLLKILFYEFCRTNHPFRFIQNIRILRAQLKNAIILSDKIIKEDNTLHYSFWMNDWALALAYLKYKRKVKKFVFRVNGFDIYDERNELGFLPFRQFIYSQSDKIFTVSESAKMYIISKYGFENKVITAYFGTKDYGYFIPESAQIFKILSCSRLINLKKVDRLANVISRLNGKIIWMHHGDGPELENILKITNTFPENIQFVHSKFIDDHDIAIQKQMEFKPNVFVSLSESEGLPVTLINAISMGIPILSTDVGGCREIVNGITGILVSNDSKDEDILSVLMEFINENWNSEEKRLQIRYIWQNQFSSQKAYSLFAQMLKAVENEK